MLSRLNDIHLAVLVVGSTIVTAVFIIRVCWDEIRKMRRK
jgi:hypothetical protein